MRLLEINDIALRLFDGEQLQLVAPAIAVLQRNDFLLGEAARAQSRLNPRVTFDQFWEHLDQQALNRPAGKARSHADIAWFYLQSVLQSAGATDEPTLLVVPAQYGSERLSLLLGIAQSCGLKIAGVAETAVLSCAGLSIRQGPLRYLDITRHRLYCTDLILNGELAVESARELKAPGWGWCEEQSIRQLASQFLQETRFDPLHEATSEQRLYDRLPALLAELNDAERVMVNLPAGQRDHRIDWHRHELVSALSEVYHALEDAVEKAGGPVVLSHRLKQLPGLVESLRQRGHCELLGDNVVARNAAHWQNELRSDAAAPVWVKALARKTSVVAGTSDLDPEPVVGHSQSGPTHLLHQGVATVLSAVHLPKTVQLQREASGWTINARADAVRLNNRPFTRGQVHIGDRLQVEDKEYLFIRVSDGD